MAVWGMGVRVFCRTVPIPAFTVALLWPTESGSVHAQWIERHKPAREARRILLALRSHKNKHSTKHVISSPHADASRLSAAR